MKRYRNIAIILARGGSKRLPGKNVLPFHGKPMLAWSVIAAVESGEFNRIVVSTDDEGIAEIGRQYGAEVPYLRSGAADDMAPSSRATAIALKQAEEHWGEQYDCVAQLMANCPLRDASDIRDAMKAFANGNAPSQVSCFRFGWMNPWWAFKMDDKQRHEYLFPDALKKRSQDLPHLYCPTGALWLASTTQFKEHGTFYMPGHSFYPLSWESALDIDDEADFQLAKAAFLVKSECVSSDV
jgi:N-acylneuraminate cytidylyltransferase